MLGESDLFFANTGTNSNTTDLQESDLNIDFLVPHQESGNPDR